jgi:phosphatidylinositol 4-kinase
VLGYCKKDSFEETVSQMALLSALLTQYAGSRDVFDGIEFYLPQLAHMIIHLEVDWDDAILERFALVIAQQSLHFALQLNWILQGALQDYRPELPTDEGDQKVCAEPNPTYNPVFYTRCLKLLRNVERVVVYGKPRAAALQRLYEQGKITKTELFLLDQADRRFNALQITAADDDLEAAGDSMQPKLDGWVDVQLPTPLVDSSNNKKSNSGSDDYVKRFCSLEKHVLNCFKSAGGCSQSLRLDRAMSLELAVISRDKKQPMILTVRTRTYQFRLRFVKEEEAKLWMRRMQEEADTTSLFQQSRQKSRRQLVIPPQEEESANNTEQGEETNNVRRLNESLLKEDLTPAQLDRYEFFQNERLFVEALTDLAEELREYDRVERKKFAPLKAAALVIPPAVYLPLCNSSNVWRRVECSLSQETRVFNTKERCPVILHFVTKRGEFHPTRSGTSLKTDPNLDVAEYMHNYFEVSSGQVEVMGELVEVDEDESEKVPVSAPKEISEEMRTPSTSEHGGSARPNIWQEDEDHEPGGKIGSSSDSPTHRSPVKGNHRVQRLLHESVVVLPAKLAKRLNPAAKHEARKNEARKHDSRKNKQVSIMDLQTEMQPPVPIIENSKRGELDGALVREVSVERSSVLFKDKIVLGDLDEGDIDIESIDRAKNFISGGESWAEKSAKMLENAIKESKKKDNGERSHDERIQSEISSCMSKSNDDLRQEVFVMQMIHYYKSVFAKANLPLWLKTYRILSTSSSTGLLEVLTDATSLDGLKKSEGYPKAGGLRKYFEMVYGKPDSNSFKAAQTNFMQSLAGYAIVSYLLGLKDRHNGNIMIDTRGHLVHIDFGFAMGMAPGHEFSMEQAPFKLTKEYVEVMGGVGSECYKEFERIFVLGMEEARKNSQIALGMVEIMMYKSNYPCFSGWRHGKGKALTLFEKRLMIKVPENQVKRKALRLIRKSRRHFGTYLYDAFQQATNGYEM